MSHPWKISRRTFLRGTGIAVALPWLEAMHSVARAAPTAAEPPLRSAFLYFPNGVWQKAWVPEKTGTEFTLPSSLTALEPIRSEVLILSGLDKAHSRKGDGHYAKTANFLTGLHVAKTTGRDISAGGISIDQLIARHSGGLTPLPSLELGIDPVISGIDSNVGYTRLYGSHISWQTPTRPVAKEISPRAVYERLFGVRQRRGGADQKVDDRQSLLDLALADAKDLRSRLGRDDQFKLDEYLDSLRAVERRIEFFSKPDPRKWHPETPAAELEAPGAPRNYQEHVQLMLDLMVLAFQTDSTRVVSFMFANDVSGRNFSFVDGVKGGHHELSHHENKDWKLDQYQKIVGWHVEQYAGMLARMQAIREGERSLLDNSMILFGCGMSDGNSHSPNNLPILVGGRGRGTIDTGRHVASPKNTPLCNVYLAMLRRLGVPADSFGDSTGPLHDLMIG